MPREDSLHNPQLLRAAKGNQSVYHALVLDARARQSLVAIRSLGRRNVRVAALEVSDGLPVPAFSSRWCQQKASCSAHEGTYEYLQCLEHFLELTAARVLIPSSDGTIALIRRHRARLEKRVSIALAKEPALAIAINKQSTLEVARRLGLSVPRGVDISSLDDVAPALREIGLPAVIKPVESWVEWEEQKGCRYIPQLVTTGDEARRVVDELVGSGETAILQQYLPGRREAVNFMYAHGQIHARFAQWAQRTYPPLGGSSVLRRSIAVPEDIGREAECLIRAIELEGYSEVEFRRDHAGKAHLMEINPRLSASIELAVRAGVDFPHLLYQWANGEAIDTVQEYRIGSWMRYLGGDVLTTIAAVLERGKPGVSPPVRSIFDFCTAFFVPMAYDYVDWRDPLPAWVASIDFIRHMAHLVETHGIRRLLRGRRHELHFSARSVDEKEGEFPHVGETSRI